MSAAPRHPSPDRWLAWLAGADPEGRPDQLESHLEACGGCRALVETLRVLPERRRWRTPSDELVERAAELPRHRRAVRPQDPLVFGWNAPDVRGGGSAVADDARIVARSCPAGEISVLSFPPASDGLVRIEGRVWLRMPSPESALVVLVHDDHVVTQLEAPDGESFSCEEILARGWQIEIHFPSGEAVVLGDPFAQD